MSAILGVAQVDKAHLMSDAAFLEKGRPELVVATHKIYALPNANGAFTARGAFLNFRCFNEACLAASHTDFDGFVDRVGEIIDDHDKRLAQVSDDADNELLIAGWSAKRAAPMLIYRCNHRLQEGVQPGAVYQVRAFTTGDLSGLPGDLEMFTVAHGIGVMEDARAKAERNRNTGGELMHTVGGYVLHASITPDRPPAIAVVHTWQDKVGDALRAQQLGS